MDFYDEQLDLGQPVFTRKAPKGAPSVYISAGVHGDEPAGPLAILECLKQRKLSQQIHWTLIPLVNPRGLLAKTRENPEGIDINRDFGPSPVSREARSLMACVGKAQFDLTLCLHEDSDGEGFYVYHHDKRTPPECYLQQVLHAAQPHTGIDLRTEIDGFPAKDGVALPPASTIEDFGESLPEALWLFMEHTSLCYTTETPSTFAAAQRIAAQVAVIDTLADAITDWKNRSS